MTKKELKQKLIDIRNGAFITPVLEEILLEQDRAECDVMFIRTLLEAQKIRKEERADTLSLAIKEIEGLPTDQLVHTLDEDGDMEIGIKKSDAIAILEKLKGGK